MTTEEMPTPDPLPFKVWVVWGQDTTVAELLETDAESYGQGMITQEVIERRISGYGFATAAEKEAFLYGLQEAEGWLEAGVYDSQQEAASAVRDIAQERCDSDNLDSPDEDSDANEDTEAEAEGSQT